MSVVIKNQEEVGKMRLAGRLASEVLDYIAPYVKPGVTTGKLNDLCHTYMVGVQGTIPAPLNYAPPGYKPFPKSICTSVNHQVCHGIPGDRVLKQGDALNIDVTVIKDGFHGDSSRMYHVGEPGIQARRLAEVTYECMWRGIALVRPGAQLGDIGAAIQAHAEQHGFSIVREFCGHGIGRKFHEEPQVLHYGKAGTGLRLEPGMTFTIEPMINAGKPGIRELADGWTIVTKDHSLSAQWEHTVLVTDNAYEVLTVSAGAPRPRRALPAEARMNASVSIEALRDGLRDSRAALREAYLKGKKPAWLLREHARLIDRTLQRLWLAHCPAPGMALVATGGYGRGELFPSSDVDVLILLGSEPTEAERERLERLVGMFWDIGLEIGHSVRTVEACVETAQGDITIETALLEARLLAGSAPLFKRLSKAIEKLVEPAAFLKAKKLEQEQRHAKYRDTPFALEPNIKEAPGGMRDLQVIRWIALACGIGRQWGDLARRGLLQKGEALRLARHEATLQDLRIRLHYLAGRREDRIAFDYQDALAAQCGYAPKASRRASELLMQAYYRNAKAITQLNTILLQNLAARFAPAPDAAPRELNERFQARGTLLEARREDLFEREPRAILESFLLMQQHGDLRGMTAGTLRSLWRARGRLDAKLRRDPVAQLLFINILQQPRGIVHEFRRMNQYDVLGGYLPEFGRIVGQMQHDLYHVYTVDQHILTVLRNLRRFTMPEFAHEFPLCSQLMSGFERHWLLYVAALFHDIAKGRGGDHSTLGTVDARRFCRRHGFSAEDTDLVSFLVEHHLTMSSVAQKQDVDDPEVARAFAAKAGSERRLVALYLLTVADIRGTSPKVWNGWKAKLLEDLFRTARRILAGEAPALDTAVADKQAEAERLLRLYALSDAVKDRFWANLDTTYFLRHDAQEIAWQTRNLHYRVDTKVPVVRARLAPFGEGLQVMIYTPDREALFARICSYFERAGFNIVEAKIHTTRNGYALDSFLVMGKGPGAHYRDMMALIESELTEDLQSQAPLPPPGSGRVSRRVRHFPIPPAIDIRPDERGSYHSLNIVASDRPGLLYRVARQLAQYKLSLYSAKINTLGDRAEDVFLVSGAALADSKAVLKLEQELLTELQI